MASTDYHSVLTTIKTTVVRQIEINIPKQSDLSEIKFIWLTSSTHMHLKELATSQSLFSRLLEKFEGGGFRLSKIVTNKPEVPKHITLESIEQNNDFVRIFRQK